MKPTSLCAVPYDSLIGLVVYFRFPSLTHSIALGRAWVCVVAMRGCVALRACSGSLDSAPSPSMPMLISLLLGCLSSLLSCCSGCSWRVLCSTTGRWLRVTCASSRWGRAFRPSGRTGPPTPSTTTTSTWGRYDAYRSRPDETTAPGTVTRRVASSESSTGTGNADRPIASLIKSCVARRRWARGLNVCYYCCCVGAGDWCGHRRCAAAQHPPPLRAGRDSLG